MRRLTAYAILALLALAPAFAPAQSVAVGPLITNADPPLAAVAVGAALAAATPVAADAALLCDDDGAGQLLAFAGAPAARGAEPWCAHLRATTRAAVFAFQQ